jgi:hypothetical protein
MKETANLIERAELQDCPRMKSLARKLALKHDATTHMPTELHTPLGTHSSAPYDLYSPDTEYVSWTGPSFPVRIPWCVLL